MTRDIQTTVACNRLDPKRPVGCRACTLRQPSVFRPLSDSELRFVIAMKLDHVSGAIGVDVVGLSRVHLMRALRTLRERGLVQLANRILTIPDRRKLARFCGYPLLRSVSNYSIL